MASIKPALPEQDPFADRREFPRVPVALPAFLVADGSRHAVHLLDVSAGGAKLDCPAKLAPGTAVMLDCGRLARTAVVRWQNGSVTGVKFDHELDPAVVNGLIDRSAALAQLIQSRA